MKIWNNYFSGLAEKCSFAKIEWLHQARANGQDPRIHHQRTTLRHAQIFWKGSQAKRAHKKSTHTFQKNSRGAPCFCFRYSSSRKHARKIATLRFQKIPTDEGEARVQRRFNVGPGNFSFLCINQCFSSRVPWASSKGSAKQLKSIASFFNDFNFCGEASLLQHQLSREFPECI